MTYMLKRKIFCRLVETNKNISVSLLTTDLGMQVVVAECVHWLAVQQHLALLRTVEVFQQTHAGALPAARRPHQGRQLAGTQGERHSLQNTPIRKVRSSASSKITQEQKVPDQRQWAGSYPEQTFRMSVSGRVG